MRGTRVKELRRQLTEIQGRPPVKQEGPKLYRYLVRNANGPIKKIITQHGKQVEASFRVAQHAAKITLLDEFRRFRRAVRRGDVQL